MNAHWAKIMGHRRLAACGLAFWRYLLSPGEFLSRSDLWRAGNVRTVLEASKGKGLVA